MEENNDDDEAEAITRISPTEFLQRLTEQILEILSDAKSMEKTYTKITTNDVETKQELHHMIEDLESSANA